MKTLLCVCLLLTLSSAVWAQTFKGTQVGNDTDNTSPDLKAFTERTRQQVKALQEAINMISSPKTPVEDKQMAIEQTLGMFMKGSTIQVSGVKNPKRVNAYSLNEYLQNLSLLGKRYKVVEMRVYKPAKIADFVKNPDGTWSGNATYFQDFSAITTAGATLHDRVAKRIETWLKKEKDAFTNQEDWMLVLGNISVVEVNEVPVN